MRKILRDFFQQFKIEPDCGIVNLAARNLLVTANLNKFVINRTTPVVNIDDNVSDSELKNMTLIVRKKLISSIVLADFSEFEIVNFQRKSEKISLVSNKLKNGFLILLLFGTSINRDETQFLSKTIILTGKQFF